MHINAAYPISISNGFLHELYILFIIIIWIKYLMHNFFWFPLFLADELMAKYILYFSYIFFCAFPGNLLISRNFFLKINPICIDSSLQATCIFHLQQTSRICVENTVTHPWGFVFLCLTKIGEYIEGKMWRRRRQRNIEPFSDHFKSFCQDQGNMKRGK